MPFERDDCAGAVRCPIPAAHIAVLAKGNVAPVPPAARSGPRHVSTGTRSFKKRGGFSILLVSRGRYGLTIGHC